MKESHLLQRPKIYFLFFILFGILAMILATIYLVNFIITNYDRVQGIYVFGYNMMIFGLISGLVFLSIVIYSLVVRLKIN